VVAYPLVALIAGAAALWMLYSVGVPAAVVAPICVLFVAASCIAFEILIRPPRPTTGKVGIVLAIVGETSDETLRGINDFGKSFSQEIERSSAREQFEVIFLPKFLAVEVRDLASATKMVHLCKSHFLVFGDIRKRKEGGKTFNVLRFQSLIRHSPIEKDAQNELQREMAASLPPKIAIDCESDLSGFELTSNQFASGAKFIIATAAMLSQDLQFGRVLLEELYSDLPLVAKQGAAIGGGVMPKLVAKRLVTCLTAICQYHHWLWRRSRDSREMQAALDAITQAQAIEPQLPDALAMQAIAAFALRRDLVEAKRLVALLSKRLPKDAGWRYSYAFLAAYEGDLRASWRWYKEAFSHDDRDTMPIEIEEFVAWIVSIEPDKYQLHYCLGIINLKRKGDRVRAREDFAEFLRACPAGQFVEEQRHATRYVAMINA
jgi:tetratricopeptide (TPR) repeat protein